MKIMKDTKNPYINATIYTIIGIAVYVLIISLLNEFTILPTIIIALVLWVSNFIREKYLK
ncbi:MAG: hypothetical protein AABW91_00305 [Nanoarchaeota archaeon]